MQASGRGSRSGGTNGGETERDVPGEEWQTLEVPMMKGLTVGVAHRTRGLEEKRGMNTMTVVFMTWKDRRRAGMQGRRGRKTQKADTANVGCKTRTQQRGPGAGLLHNGGGCNTASGLPRLKSVTEAVIKVTLKDGTASRLRGCLQRDVM